MCNLFLWCIFIFQITLFRVDLETGKKEAKILSKSSEEDIKTSDTIDQHEALKEALKNIKADYNPPQEQDSEFDPSKFRSMEELKEALGEVELNMETDIEIIKKLVESFKQTSDNADKATILEDLEYYLHQYDNALLFVDMGGLKDIITPSLNSSDDVIRKQSCLILREALKKYCLLIWLINQA